MRKGTGLYWLVITVVVFILDFMSKSLCLDLLIPYEAHPIFPGFNILLAFNSGAAFSFLDGAGGWQHVFLGGIAVVISVVLLIWLYRLSVNEHWQGIALALILGGALGNLWDRIYHGHVIDFIQLYVHLSRYWYWPVFNIADTAICVGAVMLFWHWARDAAPSKKGR